MVLITTDLEPTDLGLITQSIEVDQGVYQRDGFYFAVGHDIESTKVYLTGFQLIRKVTDSRDVERGLTARERHSTEPVALSGIEDTVDDIERDVFVLGGAP